VPINEAKNGGPGTELKKLLRLVGIKDKGGCRCNSRAREMDRQGADWCRENIDLIVSWLREEAKARKLPFSAVATKLLVRIAIKKAS